MAKATYTPEFRIKLVAKENPKRKGCKAHNVFRLYSKVETVEQFLAKGGTRADLAWDAAHGFIKVVPPVRRATDRRRNA